MIRDYTENPFEDIKEKFQKVEFYRLLTSTVSVKDAFNSKTVRNMMFKDFLQFRNDSRYKRLLYNAKMMKGWKHNTELYNGMTKNDWFQYIKKSVPECTLSTYSDNGSLRGLNSPKNPYIIIDIDNVQISDEILDKINSISCVVGTSISISGEGLWSVVRISEEIKTENQFKQVFKLLVNEFSLIGLDIDTQCSNVNRLRVLSPYEFELNNNFCSVFEPMIKVDEPDKEVCESYDVISLDSNIPDKFRIYGKEGQDYYRKATDLSLEFPEKSGRNYHILYSYANAIYRVFGDEGFKIFNLYFPETSEDILESYWGSAKGWTGFVKQSIIRELEQLEFIE